MSAPDDELRHREEAAVEQFREDQLRQLAEAPVFSFLARFGDAIEERVQLCRTEAARLSAAGFHGAALVEELLREPNWLLAFSSLGRWFRQLFFLTNGLPPYPAGCSGGAPPKIGSVGICLRVAGDGLCAWAHFRKDCSGGGTRRVSQ